MLAESAGVADPPDVIPGAVRVRVLPCEALARNFLAEGDGFHNRAAAEPPAADVINLAAGPGRAEKMIDGRDVVGAVDVVAYLFRFVTEHRVWKVLYHAPHQIREEPVQLGGRVIRPGEATPAETG